MEVIHGSLDWTAWQRAFCPPSFFSMTLHFLRFGLWSPALEITYSSYQLLLIMSYNGGIHQFLAHNFVILFLANGCIELVTTWGFVTFVARMTTPFTWIQKHSHEKFILLRGGGGGGGKKSGAYLSKSLQGVVVGTCWVYTLNKWVCWWDFFLVSVIKYSGVR